MKLPKTVNICGKTYTVTENNKRYGGEGSTTSQAIEIGTKFKRREKHFENFIHEVAETIACEDNFRYGEGASDGSIFVMTHKEFDRFIVDLATAIKPMIKELNND